MKTKPQDIKTVILNCFIEYQKCLYLTAISFTKDHFLAEDVLQDSYIKAIEKCHSLKDVAFVKTWITRIVINRCKDLLKSKKEISFEDIESPSLEDFNDEENRFFSLIEGLPPDIKEIVVLKYFNGYNFNEISSIIKMPVSTVKSKMYRALEKMKNEWSD